MARPGQSRCQRSGHCRGKEIGGASTDRFGEATTIACLLRTLLRPDASDGFELANESRSGSIANSTRESNRSAACASGRGWRTTDPVTDSKEKGAERTFQKIPK